MIDWKKYYFGLNIARKMRGLAWNQVADQTGLADSAFTRMKQGKQISANAFVVLLLWANLDLNDVIKPTPTNPSEG